MLASGLPWQPLKVSAGPRTTASAQDPISYNDLESIVGFHPQLSP